MYYPISYRATLDFPVTEDDIIRIRRRFRRYGRTTLTRLAFGRGFMVKWMSRKTRVDCYIYSDGKIFISPPDGLWTENDKTYEPGTDGWELKLIISGLTVLGTSGFSNHYSRTKLGPAQILSRYRDRIPPEWDVSIGSLSSKYYSTWGPIVTRMWEEGIINIRMVYPELPSVGPATRVLPFIRIPPKELYPIYFDVLKLVQKYDNQFYYGELVEKIAKELDMPLSRVRTILFNMSLWDWIAYVRGWRVRLEDRGRAILKRGKVTKKDFGVVFE